MTRITVAQVQEAYARTGFEPCNRIFREGNKACALTAMLYHWYPKTADVQPRLGLIIGSLGLNKDYADGFTDGYDNRSYNRHVGNNEQFAQGYDDGAAARDAIQPTSGRLAGA